MSLFRYPLRPLTHVGRTLLCAAAALLAALLLMLSPPAYADDAQAPRPESPYFAVDSDDPATDRLPLKATRVDVRIAGVIADVTVTQTYRNEGQRAIEARYVFPGSAQAAVHAMHVRLGDRLLTARIQERQQARAAYETAKKEGRTSALLEQQRPNVFEMNVANILPGDEVQVELRYTELLSPTDAEYGFVFPTVVGPRYNSPAGAAARERWIAAPYLAASGPSRPAFDLRVTLDTPLAVREVRSPTHDIVVDGTGTRQASVTLADSRANAASRPDNRDFILQYRLAGERIESGLMLYRGQHENFFLAMVQPPHVVATRQINPRDYVFVVDISGSMNGHPLDTAKALLRQLIGGLRPSDTFNVMLFSGASAMLSPQSVPATRPNIEAALRTIDAERGGGSTEIVPALQRIAALPKAADVSRSIIVITDGYVAVESEVFRLISQQLGQANLFAFGIGSSVNRHLIEGMARAGQGEAFVVTRPEQAAAQAERLRRIVQAPVLTQLQARFEGLDVYDVTPQRLPDVMAGRPVIVFGKWRGEAPAAGARLVLEGRAADGAWREAVSADGRDSATTPALRHLWARERIGRLADQEALDGGEAQRAEITALGLRYSLLTSYTSFVAIDQVVRNANPASQANVDQPLPLPQGVSPLAIGTEVPSTPEPAAWLALLLVLGIVVATVVSQRRR